MSLLTTNSKYALGALQMPVADGAELVAVRMVHSLAANPSANDVAWLGDLPPDHVPVDCIMDSSDLDTNVSPTITASVGVLNAGKTDLDTLWISASTAPQSAGIARPTTTVLARTAPSSSKQSIGLKFPAAAATFAAGTIGVTVIYRAAHGGQ